MLIIVFLRSLNCAIPYRDPLALSKARKGTLPLEFTCPPLFKPLSRISNWCLAHLIYMFLFQMWASLGFINWGQGTWTDVPFGLALSKFPDPTNSWLDCCLNQKCKGKDHVVEVLSVRRFNVNYAWCVQPWLCLNCGSGSKRFFRIYQENSNNWGFYCWDS